MTAEFYPDIIGGLGTVATQLTQSLKQMNVEPTIIGLREGTGIVTSRYKNMQMIQFPPAAPFFQQRRYSFRPTKLAAVLYARKHGQLPNVIHIHSLQFANIAMYYKQKYGIPIVYTCHSIVDRVASRKKMQKSLMQAADRVVVPSKWQQREVIRLLPSVSGKTIVIPHGVVPSLRISRAPRHSLLYAGRVIPAKGVDRLIRAVALLKRRKIDVTLHIAGKGNPLYERKIKLLARTLGIASRIRWLGFIQPHRMTQVYPRFGAVVMPSSQESFGMVAMEAMAPGVPLVTTRAGGLKEIVNAGNANIIPSVTARAIANAIASMLKHPKLTHQRVRNARATASRYTWHRAAAHYKAVYQQLI